MKILLIKTSSMGDVIHTLPALTDAKNAISTLQIDWVVEEGFQSIPAWHSAVNQIIPIALRRWRKNFFSLKTWREWRVFYRALRATEYDLVIDAQGLIKSASIGYLARSKNVVGLDAQSARERHAAWFYKKGIAVPKNQHAITRLRTLFSLALQYPTPLSAPEYGIIETITKASPTASAPYFVFLHGTTWRSKMWPEIYWRQLARLITQAGFGIKISGGNPDEVARANRIAKAATNIDVVPFLSIDEMAAMLLSAKGVIAVDTGFAHLAAAFDKPLITIYGATSASLTGAMGKHANNLIAHSPSCAPCLKRECHYTLPSQVTPACYEALTPETVWANLLQTVMLTT